MRGWSVGGFWVLVGCFVGGMRDVNVDVVVLPFQYRRHLIQCARLNTHPFTRPLHAHAQAQALKAVQAEKKGLERGIQDARKKIEKDGKENKGLGKKEGEQRKVVAKRKEQLAKK